MIVYTETTHDITVTVRPVYMDGRSDFIAKRFVFAYFIEIQNNSPFTVQLLRRHWRICNNHGFIEEIEGEGVIGKQPILAPHSLHKYNSFCVLSTFEGWMEGTYLMERENGERFHIKIPRFTLCAAAN
jgi:ApaG protein